MDYKEIKTSLPQNKNGIKILHETPDTLFNLANNVQARSMLASSAPLLPTYYVVNESNQIVSTLNCCGWNAIKALSIQSNNGLFKLINAAEDQENMDCYTMGSLKLYIIKEFDIQSTELCSIRESNHLITDSTLLLDLIHAKCQESDRESDIYYSNDTIYPNSHTVSLCWDLEIENLQTHSKHCATLGIIYDCNIEKQMQINEESASDACIYILSYDNSPLEIINDYWQLIAKLNNPLSIKIDTFGFNCYIYLARFRIFKQETSLFIRKNESYQPMDMIFNIQKPPGSNNVFLFPLDELARLRISHCIHPMDIINVYAFISQIFNPNNQEQTLLNEFIRQNNIEKYLNFQGYENAQLMAIQQISNRLIINDDNQLQILAFFLKYMKISTLCSMDNIIDEISRASKHKSAGIYKLNKEYIRSVDYGKHPYSSIILEIIIIFLYQRDATEHSYKDFAKLLADVSQNKGISLQLAVDIWHKFKSKNSNIENTIQNEIPPLNLLAIEEALTYSKHSNNDALDLLNLLQGVNDDSLIKKCVTEIANIIKNSKYFITESTVYPLYKQLTAMMADKQFQLLLFGLASNALPLPPVKGDEISTFITYYSYIQHLCFDNISHKFAQDLANLCGCICKTVHELSHISIEDAISLISKKEQYLSFIIKVCKYGTKKANKCVTKFNTLDKIVEKYYQIESFKAMLSSIKKFRFTNEINSNCIDAYVKSYLPIQESMKIIIAMSNKLIFREMIINCRISNLHEFNVQIKKIADYITGLLNYADQWKDLNFNQTKDKLVEIQLSAGNCPLNKAMELIYDLYSNHKQISFNKKYYEIGNYFDCAIHNITITLSQIKDLNVINNLNVLKIQFQNIIDIRVYDLTKTINAKIIQIAKMISDNAIIDILQEITSNDFLYMLQAYTETEFDYLTIHINDIKISNISFQIIQKAKAIKEFFQLFAGCSFEKYHIYDLNIIKEAISCIKENIPILKDIFDSKTLLNFYIAQSAQILKDSVITSNKNMTNGLSLKIVSSNSNEFNLYYINKLPELLRLSQSICKFKESDIMYTQQQIMFEKIDKLRTLLNLFDDILNQFSRLPFDQTEVSDIKIKITENDLTYLIHTIHQYSIRIDALHDLMKNYTFKWNYYIAILFGPKLWRLAEYLNIDNPKIRYNNSKGLLKYTEINCMEKHIAHCKLYDSLNYHQITSIISNYLSNLLSINVAIHTQPDISYLISTSIIDEISEFHSSHSLFFCSNTSTIEDVYIFLNYTRFEFSPNRQPLLVFPNCLPLNIQQQLIKLLANSQNYQFTIIFNRNGNSDLFNFIKEIGNLIKSQGNHIFDYRDYLKLDNIFMLHSNTKENKTKEKTAKHIAKLNNGKPTIIVLEGNVSHESIISQIKHHISDIVQTAYDDIYGCFKIEEVEDYCSLLRFLINLIRFHIIVSKNDAICIEDDWKIFIALEDSYQANFKLENNRQDINMLEINKCCFADIKILLGKLTNIKCLADIRKNYLIYKPLVPQKRSELIIHNFVNVMRTRARPVSLENEPVNVMNELFDCCMANNNMTYDCFRVIKKMLLFQMQCFNCENIQLFDKTSTKALLKLLYSSVKYFAFDIKNGMEFYQSCKDGGYIIFDQCSNLHIFKSKINFLPYTKPIIDNDLRGQNSIKVYNHFEDTTESMQFVDPRLISLFDEIQAHYPKSSYIDINSIYITHKSILTFNHINLKLKSNLPFIILGPPGAGKTYLIKYMAQHISHCILNILQIHSDTTKSDIENSLFHAYDEFLSIINTFITPSSIGKYIKNADSITAILENYEYWILFDEFDRSKHVDLICDIMINKRYKHIKFPFQIKFLATGDSFISFSEVPMNNGLSQSNLYKKENFEILQHEYGKDTYYPIPIHALNYALQNDDLSGEDIREYINLGFILNKSGFHIKDLYPIIFRCNFSIQKEYSKYLSFSDLNRVFLIAKWLQVKWFNSNDINILVKSLNMSLYLCYYLKSPQNYKSYLKFFKITYYDHYYYEDYDDNDYKNNDIQKAIEIELNQFSKIIHNSLNMVYQSHIFKQTLMTLIASICNYIPVFLIGEPGSGKSLIIRLLKSIVNSELCKAISSDFPQIILLHYHCSHQTTTQDVENIINIAIKYRSNSIDKSAIVTLILDNMDSANDYEKRPLQILHQYLERENMTHHKIGFVGISTTFIEPSFIERGLLINLSDTTEELKQLCCHIYNKIDSPNEDKNVYKMLDLMVESYINNVHHQSEIFSLRDLYSTIQHFAYLNSTHKNQNLHGLQMHALESIDLNFSFCNTLNEVDDGMHLRLQKFIMKAYPQSLEIYYQTKASTDMLLLRTLSLTFPPLIINVNYLLKLIDSGPYMRYLMIITEDGEENIIAQKIKLMKEYKIINGSEFKSSITLLSKIAKKCRNGDKVVLVNCECVYDRLYDLLNRDLCDPFYSDYYSIVIEDKEMPCCYRKPSFSCITVTNNTGFSHLGYGFVSRFVKFYVKEDN